MIHEKRLFLISDTGGSEEKVRVEPVTSFLKIIVLHQKRKYQSDSIRSAVRSDPDFVEGLPLPKNLFTTDVPFSRKCLASPMIQNSPFQSLLYSPILPTRSSEFIWSVLFRLNSFKSCGILKTMPATQNWDASHRSTFNGTCDFSHFTDKTSTDFSEGLWNHIFRGENIHTGQSQNIPLVHAFLVAEKLRNFIANFRQFVLKPV